MVAAALLTTTLKADTMSDALMRRPTGVISTFQQQQTIISQSVDFCFLRRSSFIMYRQRWIDWQTNRDVDKETEGEGGRWYNVQKHGCGRLARGENAIHED